MDTFLEARHREARARYLAQCANMHETNLAWAEKEGGVQALEGAKLARYKGIESRLIELAAYGDAVQDYIESLQEYIDELLQEKKRLRAQLAETTGDHPLPPPIPYREFIGMMVLGTRIPVQLGALLSSKEGRRQAIKNKLAIDMPYLFSINIEPKE